MREKQATDGVGDHGRIVPGFFEFYQKNLSLLTNNPKKVIGLEGYGLEIVDQVPISMPANPHNEEYLETKRFRMGHII